MFYVVIVYNFINLSITTAIFVTSLCIYYTKCY
jgi:hypothetical protein